MKDENFINSLIKNSKCRLIITSEPNILQHQTQEQEQEQEQKQEIW